MLRVAIGLVAVVFMAMSIWSFAQAIFLGWSAVASPAVAAVATAISYLAIGIVALALASLRSSHSKSFALGSHKNGTMAAFAVPVVKTVSRHPLAALLAAVAAAVFVDNFRRDRRRHL